MQKHNPDTVSPPLGTYSHAVELEGPQRFVFGAGQVGIDPDGSVGDGIEAQARIVWDNIRRVLAAVDMEIADIVQLNMLLVDRADFETAMAVRAEALAGHHPASTLMYVAGLASPDFLIEIDYVAARPAH